MDILCHARRKATASRVGISTRYRPWVDECAILAVNRCQGSLHPIRISEQMRRLSRKYKYKPGLQINHVYAFLGFIFGKLLCHRSMRR